MSQINYAQVQGGGGLTETKEDDRDFNLGAFLPIQPSVEELPDDFQIAEPVISHQKDKDYCTAFATTQMSAYQDVLEYEISPSNHQQCFVVLIFRLKVKEIRHNKPYLLSL